LLHQDTQEFGPSASLPAVSPTHADDAAAAAHAVVADASGGQERTGEQPSTGIGLGSSRQTRPSAIPTVLGAGRYVMSMKSVTDRELRAGRAPDAARCAGLPDGPLT
jgi:hypothetical protein